MRAKKKRFAIFEFHTVDNYTKRADFEIPKGNLSTLIYQNWNKWVKTIQSNSPVRIKIETIKFKGTVYN